MSRKENHNKLNNNPGKSYEEIAIDKTQGCQNLVQSIIYNSSGIDYIIRILCNFK